MKFLCCLNRQRAVKVLLENIQGQQNRSVVSGAGVGEMRAGSDSFRCDETRAEDAAA